MSGPSPKHADISYTDMNALLQYNPINGTFKWRKPRRQATNVAGCLNDRGYVVIQILGKKYKAHRVAWLLMTKKWPKRCLDHENNNRSDNRWKNLRECTAGQNNHNKVDTRAKTGYRGVCLTPSRTYRAQIRHDGKSTSLGCFKTAAQAAIAYNRAASKLYGKFAQLNTIKDKR